MDLGFLVKPFLGISWLQQIQPGLSGPRTPGPQDLPCLRTSERDEPRVSRPQSRAPARRPHCLRARRSLAASAPHGHVAKAEVSVTAWAGPSRPSEYVLTSPVNVSVTVTSYSTLVVALANTQKWSLNEHLSIS